jgi:predicted MarR family transcription regulator
MADSNENAWHLAKNEAEHTFVNFEYLFWRAYHSWIMWQEDCQSCIANDMLTAPEIAILHIIRMKERPKTVYEIGRLLNRDDTPNVQYGVKKLMDIGYVEKVDLKSGPKKAVAYKITNKGIKNTDAFVNVRNNVLLKLVDEHGVSNLGLADATKALSIMKGIYEEGSRLAAMYKNDPSAKN